MICRAVYEVNHCKAHTPYRRVRTGHVRETAATATDKEPSGAVKFAGRLTVTTIIVISTTTVWRLQQRCLQPATDLVFLVVDKY